MEIRELARDRAYPIGVVPRGEWPPQLLEIPQPPKKLWMRGALPAAGTKLLAVVGSRAMTRYGQEACEKLVAGLAGYPVSIVSGLALGVDTCAHKAALAAGLHTLALPGSGLADRAIYPRSNRPFAAEILERGGGLLSEYAPEQVSRIHYFPERNRLMVGLADAVLVVEASNRSGTLITARLASEYCRELLCIPHRIGDPHAFGPHLFIRLGATLVTEPLHILEALKIPPRESDCPTPDAGQKLEGIEKQVWELLAEPRARDEIVRSGRAGAGETLTALVALELRGLIREEFGAWRRV